MKEKANKSARIQEGKRSKPSNKQGLQYLCFFFIYVQDKFIHLNFLKRTVQKKEKGKTPTKKNKRKRKKYNSVHQYATLQVSLHVGDRRWSRRGREDTI